MQLNNMHVIYILIYDSSIHNLSFLFFSFIIFFFFHGGIVLKTKQTTPKKKFPLLFSLLIKCFVGSSNQHLVELMISMISNQSSKNQSILLWVAPFLLRTRKKRGKKREIHISTWLGLTENNNNKCDNNNNK